MVLCLNNINRYLIFMDKSPGSHDSPAVHTIFLYALKRFAGSKLPYIKIILAFFFYFVLSFLHRSHAQPLRAVFTHLTNLDGLSQSTVQAIVKDKYGFMWFGTQEGLNRYDGYSFKVYRHQLHDSTSLRRSNILSLHEDAGGNLWVGVSNGGLSLYDRKRDAFIHFGESKNGNQGLSQRSPTVIYEDRQHNLWIGTYWKLNLLDRRTGKITWYGHDPSDTNSLSDDNISAITQDRHNNLWIGTPNGLNIFDTKTKKARHFFHDPADPASLSSSHIHAIMEDNRGRIWIATENGLNLFHPASATFTRFVNDPADPGSLNNNSINHLADNGDERIWVGTSSSLDLLDPVTGRFTHFTSETYDDRTLNRNASVMSMLFDKEGILWVGTHQGGINIYDRNLIYFDHYKNNPANSESLSFNSVTGFAENADGDIWITTGGGALNLWKKKENRFIRYNPDPTNKNSLSSWGVLCLYQSKKNNYLWIGNYGNCIDCYDPVTNIFKHYTYGNAPDQLNSSAVYTVTEDSKGNIWMGTNGGGVNVLNQQTGIITKYVAGPNDAYSISGNFVRCFVEDHKGNMWIGTTNGVCMYDPETGKFSRFDHQNTMLESDIIFSLFEDRKGNIWIGTLGGGLNKLAPLTKKIVSYTTSNGLPDNTVNAIVEDKLGHLWLSTNNGISRFNPAKNSFRNFGLHNGIQSFEFSIGAGLRTSKGEILFGGVNGFNAFDPAQLTENKNITPVVITDFRLFNEPVIPGSKNSPLQYCISQTKSIRLSYSQSIITFEFAALGFTAPQKNQYAYMLDGFDRKWIYAGSRRTATYTNLDPGSYRFRVKACNNDGLWNEQETTVAITITPPYWKTWWFRTLLALMLMGVMVALHRMRIKAVNANRAILEQQVLERTESLVAMTQEERRARQRADMAIVELERKNKELEQFAYVASHDLQEPLRTTSGFAELLQRRYKGKLDEKADTYLSYILTSADRMKILIKDLLDYSRIGRKKEKELIDCNTLLNNLKIDLHEAIRESNARIISDTLPVIYGYPTEIKQLFQNLLLNAMKFRKKDTAAEIHLSVVKTNDQWQFSFKDNGIGIEEQYWDRIFIIFQRLHTRTQYEGSGIGLAHCKKIAELHGGKIWVESQYGNGSTFHFTILE